MQPSPVHLIERRKSVERLRERKTAEKSSKKRKKKQSSAVADESVREGEENMR